MIIKGLLCFTAEFVKIVQLLYEFKIFFSFSFVSACIVNLYFLLIRSVERLNLLDDEGLFDINLSKLFLNLA